VVRAGARSGRRARACRLQRLRSPALDATRLAGLPLAFAALAGLWLGRAGGALARLAGAWLVAGLLFLMLVPAFHSERYSLAVLPAWLRWPRSGSRRRGWRWCSRPARHVWLKPALALAVLASALSTCVSVQRRALTQLPLEVVEVARAAAPRLVAGERVYARKPHFAWVAHLTATAFPFADSLSQLAADARRDGVRWIYFSWPEAEMRPQFAWLLGHHQRGAGAHRARGEPRTSAVLYEIGPGFGREPDWFGDAWALSVHNAAR